MTTRNTLLTVTAAALLAAGVWWFSQSASAPLAEKAAATPAAPVTPAPKVAAPVVPPVVPSAQPKPMETPAPAPPPDADLNTAVNDLITALESQDANAVAQCLFPSMLEGAKKAAITSLAQNPNMTPEMQARMDQIIEQQKPQMIQQLTQRMAQDPSALQGYQKLGAALKHAQNIPPTMNAAGDQATYTLDLKGIGGLSPKVVMTLRDGEWAPDFSTMNIDLVIIERNAADGGQ